MRIKFVLSLIIASFFCIVVANSQIIPHTQRVSLSENDKIIIDQRISKYTAFVMDKKELASNLGGKGQIQLRINEEMNWTLNLEFNDMRAPDFRQTYTTDEGEFEYKEPFVVNTFKGETSDGKIARFTIDENTFFGIILDDKDHYVIRAVNDYTKNGSNEILIAYRYSDIIRIEEERDFITDALVAPEHEFFNDDFQKSKNEDSFLATLSCVKHLRVATEADYPFFQAMGYDLNKTYQHIFSVLNIVSGVYEKTFKMVLYITYQGVFTAPHPGLYHSNDAEGLLNQFRNHWNNHMQSVPRNIAHFFTGKSFNGILGVAWVSKLDQTYTRNSSSYAYGLSVSHPRLHAIVAHEIGHNLGASGHPPNFPALPSDCLCNNSFQASIMCPFVSNAPNLWFCQQSINEIHGFIHNNVNNRAILQTYSWHTTMILSTPQATGFKLYQATQTINSTQTIQNGFTKYRAGKSVTLNNGFKVESGASFSISIEDFTDCDD